jgi:hypothetical protein
VVSLLDELTLKQVEVDDNKAFISGRGLLSDILDVLLKCAYGSLVLRDFVVALVGRLQESALVLVRLHAVKLLESSRFLLKFHDFVKLDLDLLNG